MSVRKKYLITIVSKLHVPRIDWRADREMETSSALTMDLKAFCSVGKKKIKSKNRGLERPVQIGEGELLS